MKSKLPQRRKSDEEIARLRENLGIPGERGKPGPPPGPDSGPPPPLPETRKDEALVRPAPRPGNETLPSRPEVAGRGKPVRSLKRSERMPAPVRPAMESEKKRSKRGDSQLPDHRHDDRELQRIRATNAMMVKPPVEQIKSLAAHPALVVLGYLLAFAGGIGGLIIALYLFLKKPRSHYHAAFMTIIAMLVLVFGILYFIPQPDAP